MVIHSFAAITPNSSDPLQCTVPSGAVLWWAVCTIPSHSRLERVQCGERLRGGMPQGGTSVIVIAARCLPTPPDTAACTPY